MGFVFIFFKLFLYKIYSLYAKWELVAAKKRKNSGVASKNEFLKKFRAKPEKLM